MSDKESIWSFYLTEKEISKSRRRNAIVLGSSQVVRRAFRAVFVLVAAHVLGPQSFGTYAVLFAVIELLAVVSGVGFIDYLTREVAKAPASGRELWLALTKLRLFYLIPLVALALAGLDMAGYSKVVLVGAGLFAAALLPRTVVDSTQGVLRALHRFNLLLVLELVQGAVLLALGFVLLSLGAGLRGVIWTEVCSATAGLILAVPMVMRFVPSSRASHMSLSGIARETFVFNIYPVMANLYDRFDVILLSKLAGDAAAGIYAIPYRALIMLQIVPYGIMGVLLPSLSRDSWGTSQQKSFDRLTGMLYGAALFCILGTVLLADPLVDSLLGAAYRPSALVIKILIWASIPAFLNYAMNTLILARSRERLFLLTTGICLFANLAANLILIPRFSYLGAAFVTIFTELLLLVQNLAILRKCLGYMPSPHKLLKTSIIFFMVLCLAAVARRAIPVSSVAIALPALAVFAFSISLSGVFRWKSGAVGQEGAEA